MTYIPYHINIQKRPESLVSAAISGLTITDRLVPEMADSNLRTIHRAYKTELDPTLVQAEQFAEWCEVSRRVYNMALRIRRDWYERTGESISAYSMMGAFTQFKKRPDCQWLSDAPRRVIDEAIKNLDAAYTNFFRRLEQGGKPGFPRFKRHCSSAVFQGADLGGVEVGRVKLPRIGWVRLKEKGYIPTDRDKYGMVTVSTRAGRWFVSVMVQEVFHERAPSGDPIGVDMGIKHMVALDDGTTIDNPKPLAKQKKRLKKLQRKLSRQKEGGANYRKTKDRIAKTHYKITCIRQDALHKASRHIIDKDPISVVVEDLNISGMVKNHHLAPAISDVGMHELRRQIEYKADWNGSEVIVADRWFASSKTCSGCGHVNKDLVLGDREYVCPECGLVIDRDVNAAINLREYGTARHVGTEPKASEGGEVQQPDLFGKRCPSRQEEPIMHGGAT